MGGGYFFKVTFIIFAQMLDEHEKTEYSTVLVHS